MAKGPLVTRSELRRHQKAEEKRLEKEADTVLKQSKKEFKEEEKRIDSFYRKEAKKNQPITKTRSVQNQRSRQMDRFLAKWIVIVLLLLVAVLLMVFFL